MAIWIFGYFNSKRLNQKKALLKSKLQQVSALAAKIEYPPTVHIIFAFGKGLSRTNSIPSPNKT